GSGANYFYGGSYGGSGRLGAGVDGSLVGLTRIYFLATNTYGWFRRGTNGSGERRQRPQPAR
ncbi:MAG: hypothetical protein PHV28_04750, partial [Kiritimatiellae bacterium]|nr:hypothetical protein [Kiritimatiellia bacterium]